MIKYRCQGEQERSFNELLRNNHTRQTSVALDFSAEKKEPHSNIVFNLLWHPHYNQCPILDKMLQGLPYDPLNREMKINFPPEKLELKLEELSRHINYHFSNIVDSPTSEVVYQSLSDSSVSGASSQNIISDTEAIALAKELDNRGFDVLTYTQINGGIRIMGFSEVLTAKFRTGIQSFEKQAKGLKLVLDKNI